VIPPKHTKSYSISEQAPFDKVANYLTPTDKNCHTVIFLLMQ